MKLNAHRHYEDYHDVVAFAECVMVDGVEIKHCVSVNIDAGIATVVTQPLRVMPDETLLTHTVKGKIEIKWREGSKVFEHLYNDWIQREKLRKQEQHAI